jgi:crotonobetainyl-CoA:carnitine CoA-transferase CaiB-like acyl-CoA transferase
VCGFLDLSISAKTPCQCQCACRLDRLIGNGGIPTAPILSYVEVCQEKQFWDNDYFVNIPYPEYEAHFGKPYRAIGFPATFSVSQPPPPSSPAPELGQHTIECLTEKLGYNEAEAKGLIGEGITHEATPQTLHGKM